MSIEVQPEELVSIFSHNFKARRLALGLSQSALAVRLDCHVPYISDLENEKKTPFLGNLAKIADALETTPDALLTPPNGNGKKSRRAS